MKIVSVNTYPVVEGQYLKPDSHNSYPCLAKYIRIVGHHASYPNKFGCKERIAWCLQSLDHQKPLLLSPIPKWIWKNTSLTTTRPMLHIRSPMSMVLNPVDTGKANLSTSAREQQRLEEQSEALKTLMHGSFFHAPVKDPKLVIDIGCGTGVVTRELASKFTEAQVYGVDLCDLPGQNTKLPNLGYIQGNVRELMAPGGDSRLAPGTVDYTFQRLLVCGMTDWPGYVKDLAGGLRSGGWAEIHEVDWQMYEDGVENMSWEWLQECIRGGWEYKKLDLRCAPKVAGWMKDAGLVDVQSVVYELPAGTSKTDGTPENAKIVDYMKNWWATVMWVSISNLVKDANQDRVNELRAQMLKDLENAREGETKWHPFVVTWGRKP